MAKLELKVRDLKSGEESILNFEGEEAAAAWLRARPSGVDCLGLLTTGVPAEVNQRLRAAVRPLDDEERALEEKLDAQKEAAAQARRDAKQQQERLAAAAHRAAMASADPNRPMEIHYRYNQDLELSDPADARPITDEAREAVKAWVEERNSWVEGRGQVVGDAKITVYPGPLPASAGGERVKGGSFIPVTAPAKS